MQGPDHSTQQLHDKTAVLGPKGRYPHLQSAAEHDRPYLRAGDNVMEHGKPVQPEGAGEAFLEPGRARLPAVQNLWQDLTKI